MSGFAAGVMIAASVWSLILPSIEMSAHLKFAWLPAGLGFILGVAVLLVLDKLLARLTHNIDSGIWSNKKLAMTALAVTIHNIPEGMAVGVVYGGLLAGLPNISESDAFLTALGVAIQNIPEGAVISLPCRGEGMKKGRSLLSGILSGAVEPIAAGITLLLTSMLACALPYLLALAAGAMFYVVICELIPDAFRFGSSISSTAGFTLGFSMMMILDVALG